MAKKDNTLLIAGGVGVAVLFLMNRNRGSGNGGGVVVIPPTEDVPEAVGPDQQLIVDSIRERIEIHYVPTGPTDGSDLAGAGSAVQVDRGIRQPVTTGNRQADAIINANIRATGLDASRTTRAERLQVAGASDFRNRGVGSAFAGEDFDYNPVTNQRAARSYSDVTGSAKAALDRLNRGDMAGSQAALRETRLRAGRNKLTALRGGFGAAAQRTALQESGRSIAEQQRQLERFRRE